MSFKLLAKDPSSHARTGELKTDHGIIKTPVFMPVGTAGTVKAVHAKELKEDINAQIILGNTYHLYLRPGLEILEKAGGLHQFIGWDRPTLSDSGGYQVYSLSAIRKLIDDGVKFQSHIDGSYHLFTPEKVIDIQRTIGADIIMAFDECTPYPCDFDYAKKSMVLTHQWLHRCIKQINKTQVKYDYNQVFFPIVQGSTFPDLRKESAEHIAAMNLSGNAIGGLSVGEPVELMYEMTSLVCNILPNDKPRYLMGVGTPVNILECIALGIDMFDCVIPTRNGRNGMLFTNKGIINIKNEKWKNDFSPIDEEGNSFVDLHYSRAYLRHLFNSKEMLGSMIASLHNLSFYINLLDEARKYINKGSYYEWKNSVVKDLEKRL
ncbi:tRNA guanosine(34) transglycosylase Tgt [Bacteroidota bacterium]